MEVSTIFGAERQVKLVYNSLILLSFVVAFYSYTTYASRVNDKIYSILQSDHYCSRRLNATHQMGCTSELGGNQGVVWVVEDQDDLNHILYKGTTPPYVAILKRIHYNRKNLLDFKAKLDRIAGVVFLDGDHEDSKSRMSPFSPEDTCPNRYVGLYVNDTDFQDCKRNVWQQESPISGLLYDDIPFPIFLINEKKSIDDLESCFTNNNIKKGTTRTQDTYPLCSIQLDSFMLAASDTTTCLNSHSLVDDLLQSIGLRCVSVDNQNIFAYYKPAFGPLRIDEATKYMRPDIIEAQSVVLVIVKLSSLSMFTEVSPGADSTITSIVTLLAVAEALGKVRNNTDVSQSSRNLAFALLDSEPFDYTGSSRMVFDMKNNSFPNGYFGFSNQNNTDAMQNVNLDSLDYVINLDQMANYPNSSEIYMHVDPRTKDDSKLNNVLDILKRMAEREKVNFKHNPDLQTPLPPSPVHTFIQSSQSSSNKLFGFVLSNYAKTYNNLFYNSIYDDSHNVYQTSQKKLVEHISQVATFVAKSLYQLTFKSDKTDDIVADKATIEDLLNCYINNASCPLFTRAWQAGHQLPSGSIQTYKDPTKQSDDMNSAITSHLLAYFIGDRMNGYNITKCYEESRRSRIYDFQYVNGKNEPVKDGDSGICIRSQVLTVPARSPAYEFKENGFTINRKYPAWTASLNGIRNPVRLFLEPSPLQQWCIFLLGLVVTLMSFVTVHQVKKSIYQQSETSNTLPTL